MVTKNTRDICYGMEVATGKRISFSRAVHQGKMMQIRGETGGGKSLLTTALAIQYLQSYTLAGRPVIDPLMYFDFGGDLFSFHAIKEECERLGRTFRWFSLDPLDATFYFAPLQSCQSLQGSSGRKANFVTAGLNLAYTEGFGTGYFGRLNLSTIREAFMRLEAKGVTSPSLIQLGEELRLMARTKKNNREAAEALYALDQLLDYPALSLAEDPSRRIDIDLALEESHVVYFFLPTLQETLAARATGTLAVWSVINTAAYRKKTGKAARNILLILDEAAQIAQGQSFQDALVLSRKYGIRKHIIHQSEAQLKNARGTDMSQVVRDNCAIKAFFTTDASSKGQELDDLQGYSKDEIVSQLGSSRTGLRTTTSEQERKEPILKRNTVLETSATFGQFFLTFKDGKDHQEPLRLMSEFPTTKAKHEQLSNRPLPSKPVPAPKAAVPAVSSKSEQRATTTDPAGAERQKKLSDLFRQLQLEERWKLSK